MGLQAVNMKEINHPMDVSAKLKKCNKCGKLKPTIMFSSHLTSGYKGDRLKNMCKECSSEGRRKWAKGRTKKGTYTKIIPAVCKSKDCNRLTTSIYGYCQKCKRKVFSPNVCKECGAPITRNAKRNGYGLCLKCGWRARHVNKQTI